jgi:hypothetical protein
MIDEIAEMRKDLEEGFLWVSRSDGRAILWETEEKSRGDNGYNAINSWHLGEEGCDMLSEQYIELIDENNF